MKNLTLIFFILLGTSLKSQTIWVKGYAGLGSGPQLELIHNLNPYVLITSSRTNASAFVMPAIVLEHKKGTFWEFGFAWKSRNVSNDYVALQVPPSDSVQLVDLGATKSKGFDAQIEYNFRLHRKIDTRWKTYMGIAINPHWSKLDYTSHQSYLYDVKSYFTGIHWGIVPRLQYNLSKNLFLDLNAALFVISSNYIHTAGENPALTYNQNRSSLFEIDLLRKYSLRVGLAWRIKTGKSED